MVQAVSRGSLTAEARARSQASPFGFFGGQSGIGTDFFRVILFFPVRIIQPILHTHLHAGRTRRTNGRSLGTVHKAILFQKSGSFG